jgi:hypothetical protein
VLVALVLCCALWVFFDVEKRRGAYFAVLPMLLLPDALCLVAAGVLAPGEPMIRLLHTLVCSATLPALVAWLIRAVHNARSYTKEEDVPCPSEK